MPYLMIRNPGVADYRAFTLLGVSTTRNMGREELIGQFGSGSKLALALLLRLGIEVIVIAGNLKMTFFVKEESIKGQTFRRVCVKYSGTDLDGNTKNSTEDLGFTLEWGVQDWKLGAMGFREFVSNAIDGSIVAGGSAKSVEFEVVEKPRRAARGYTSVYLEYTEDVETWHGLTSQQFLHFNKPEHLKCKCLPKRNVDEDKVLIYKKGVLVSFLPGKSVFDYNLGDELSLDESRNASEWDVRYSVARALRNESVDNLTTILKGVIANPEVWESKLDSSYLSQDKYASEETMKQRREAFTTAWVKAAGPKGVVTSGSVALASFVEEKGYTPVHVTNGWAKALESYAVPCEATVLTRNELEGKTLSAPTEEMLSITKKVWATLESFALTNGKQLPGVQGFTSIMDGSSSTKGYYILGGADIYLHTSLGGKDLFKVALEEIIHYTTGSDDKSRDIQDFLFLLVTEMAY